MYRTSAVAEVDDQRAAAAESRPGIPFGPEALRDFDN